MRRNQVVDYSKYETHFNQVAPNIKDEPIPHRGCNDVACLVVFFILTIAFIGIGAYSISNYHHSTALNNHDIDVKQYWDVVAVGVVTSLVVSVFYVILIRLFTRIMIYVMMILSLTLLAILAVFGLISGNAGLAISMGVTLLIYLIVLGCLRKKIETGITLVRVATRFITEKPAIFLAPLVNLVFTLIIATFWMYVVSMLSATIDQKQQAGQDAGMQYGFLTFYALMWLFFMFLFYYLMVFIIATVCSHWYYGIEGSGLVRGLTWVFTKQFGSLVFASLLIAVVTLARMVVEGQRRNNKKNLAVAVCLCIVACLLRALEDILRIINHYTVIVMSITGESFLQGAQSAMGLLFQQLGLLNISNIICNFLIMWGIIVSVGIPALIAYFLMSGKHSDDVGAVMGIVILMSMMTSLMIFEILVESVGCIFIFYAIDRRFVGMGLYSQYRLPIDMHNQLNSSYSSDEGYNRY